VEFVPSEIPLKSLRPAVVAQCDDVYMLWSIFGTLDWFKTERLSYLCFSSFPLQIVVLSFLGPANTHRNQGASPWNGPHRNTKRSTWTAKSARTPTLNS